MKAPLKPIILDTYLFKKATYSGSKIRPLKTCIYVKCIHTPINMVNEVIETTISI